MDASHIHEEAVLQGPFTISRQRFVSLEVLGLRQHKSDTVENLGTWKNGTRTLLHALESWPNAIPKRKSGPRNPIIVRWTLSRRLWYHVSPDATAFGWVATQQQRKMVRQLDQRMSMLPLSLLEETHPASGTW